MCENRYLHLPVVDEDTGRVLGVVDVMEIVQATVGQEGSSGYVSNPSVVCVDSAVTKLRFNQSIGK